MEFTHLKRQEKLFLTFYKINNLPAQALTSSYNFSVWYDKAIAVKQSRIRIQNSKWLQKY
ncbi:MAG TPA: hypothetical protein DCR21_05155 [Succinivibrionaceae bacterium]|nr:hypothetical protein [Succinivibrionaceae bacterium]